MVIYSLIAVALSLVDVTDAPPKSPLAQRSLTPTITLRLRIWGSSDCTLPLRQIGTDIAARQSQPFDNYPTLVEPPPQNVDQEGYAQGGPE